MPERYRIERRGTDHAPWTIVHTASGLTVPVWRPYPGQEVGLPPIQVANHRSRPEAEAAAQEIDWAEVDRTASSPEGIEVARRAAQKREDDRVYSAAMDAARAGTEPYPWEPGGLLHREAAEVIELGQLEFDTSSQESVEEAA